MSRGIVVALGLWVAGCAASAPTVAYYRANPKALNARLDECIASAEDSQDCRNAKQAYAARYGVS